MAGPKPSLRWKSNVVYDAFLWLFSIIIELFFREVHPRSTWKVPKKGPVLIVAAPHANQFVDPLILMRVLRMDAHRRVCWLIAEKSTKRAFIGFGARIFDAVPVGRALDLKKPATGKIYLPDPEGDPTLVRGRGTKFDHSDFEVGGLLVLPTVNNEAANSEIKEIVGPEEIRVKKPFKGAVALRQLTGQDVQDADGKVMDDKAEKKVMDGFEGTKFSVAPRVDQSAVYSAVFNKLQEGGCIGIFPEGGSHDRTELLPLKAGVAIMALGALAENPDCGVKIVPCGMNYFHAHKFRSRAVVEFGTPVEIPPELVEKYKHGERREAVAAVLEMVYGALRSVTVTAPDYDTLMLIQAVRRLYNPKGKKLPLPMIVELNRRLVRGYQVYKDDPRINDLKRNIINYNKDLMRMNVRDHQVSYAKFSIHKVVFILLYRLGKLAALSIAVLPGLFLFAPIFIAGKLISIKKSREALAASSVKVRANDVVATWKLLVAMALAPALYTFYTVSLTYWTYYNRVGGRVPDWIPLWLIVVLGYVVFPTITFAALRFGEVGMDIAKSVRPLVLSLSHRSGNTLHKLRVQRAQLVEQVTNVINELGPELYPDFNHQRIINDPSHPLSPSHSRPSTPGPRTRNHTHDGSDGQLKMTPDSQTSNNQSPTLALYDRRVTGVPASASDHLPRNESFKNLGSVGIFATRPDTPNRSRSRSSSSKDLAGLAMTPTSGGGSSHTKHGGRDGIQPMTNMDSKGGFEEVSLKIRGAMRERGRRRKSEEVVGNGNWILADGEEGEGDGEGETSDFEPEEAKKDI